MLADTRGKKKASSMNGACGRIKFRDDRFTRVLRQNAPNQIDFFANFHGREIHVRAPGKLDGHERHAFDRLGGNAIDAADRADRVGNRIRNQIFDFLRGRLRIDRNDRQARKLQVRQEVNFQIAKGNQSHQHQAEKEHGSRHRTTYGEFLQQSHRV